MGAGQKQSRRIFEKLREEANGCLLGRMVAEERKTTRRVGGQKGRMGRIVVRRVGGMHNFWLLGEKNQEVRFW